MKITTTYRVECNYGSKYFDNERKAIRYYCKQEAKGLDVEFWICTQRMSKNLFSKEQVMALSTSFEVRICL